MASYFVVRDVLARLVAASALLTNAETRLKQLRESADEVFRVDDLRA